MLSVLYEHRFMSKTEVERKENKLTDLYEEQEQLEKKLLERLDGEDRELFQEYVRLGRSMLSCFGEIDYEQGFRDGLRMGAWALTENE